MTTICGPFVSWKAALSLVSVILTAAVYELIFPPVHACASTRTTPATSSCVDDLTSLTRAQLTTYISTYDEVPDSSGTLVNFGTADIVNNGDGTYAATCQCSGEGDTCYLELAGSYVMFLGHTTEIYDTPNAGDGTYDLVTSGTITCDSNGDAFLDDLGQNVENYACYTYKHNQCQSSMTSLTEDELNQYIALFDDSPDQAGTLVNFGTVKIVEANNKFKVQCQCSGEGDTCYLEMDTDAAAFLDEKTILQQSDNNGDGTYGVITSPLISCDDNGNNILDGQVVGKYACYSYLHENCQSMLTKLTTDQTLAYVHTFDDTDSEGRVEDTFTATTAPDGTGFTMNCQCSGAGDACLLEFSDSFVGFLEHRGVSFVQINNGDGTYPLVTTSTVTCDENGNNILEGKTVKRYTCYTLTLTAPVL